MSEFKLRSGLIYMPLSLVYGNVRLSLSAIVDTGSAGTAIDINLIQLERCRPSRIVEISGIGGSQDVVIQDVEELEFCDQIVKSFPIEFGDIESTFGFNAIVGSDLLDAIGAVIDYKQHQIFF